MHWHARANQAIIRERHPIPTVDEVIQELSHRQHFSKLDLTKGYHKIELDESSRGITTFATQSGLYRYKILMFEISSAPEMYQHIVQQVLHGCDGTANISDNIVHGRTAKEHDRRLKQVVSRLEEQGLTLNPNKCEFNMPRLKFMGHIISKDGISPTQDKMNAIVNAREPETAGEVRSFLGLVNFCARFLPDLTCNYSRSTSEMYQVKGTVHMGQPPDKGFPGSETHDDQNPSISHFWQRCGNYGRCWCKSSWARSCFASATARHVEGDQLCQSELVKCRETILSNGKRSLGVSLGFSLYLMGRHFTLVTDHKPLETINLWQNEQAVRKNRTLGSQTAPIWFWSSLQTRKKQHSWPNITIVCSSE